MGKKVSDLVLYFSSSLAYSEVAEVWPIYRRRIVPLKVSDLVLCFSSSSAYSEVVKVWPTYIHTANRTIARICLHAARFN